MEKPISISELTKLREPVVNVKTTHRENLSALDKFALWITKHVGTMGFFIIIFLWTVSWLTWNTLAPDGSKFDPFPGFVLWLFISNMIQIFLMPLLMIGQNLQSKQSDLLAEANYKVDLQSQREIQAIMEHLEYIESVLEKKN